ncbi:MAG TPA: heterodisulfide reductase-related iron-sulfur binding cluster [Acidimicrobiia bacterium]|nr:heterodisulfide reductase-related iron-sulfur binding cluster [Acidimicrobiia bacterium]
MRGATALAVLETREVFSHVHGATKILFYVLAAAATLAFADYAWKRVKKYRRGRAIGRWREMWEQTRARKPELVAAGRQLARSRPLQTSLAAIASNSTVSKRDRKAGTAHFFVFWGFITLFIGTCILTLDTDILAPISDKVVGHEIHFFHGPFYLVYSFILDVMGLGAIIGLAYLIGRRATHPPQLDYTRAEKPEEGYSRSGLKKGDALFAWSLMVILVTGFLQEGFRLVATHFPSFEVWSPVGWVAGKAFSGVGLSAANAEHFRLATWWTHAILALAFVAYIPISKAMHMVVDVANLTVHDPAAARHLPKPAPDSDHVGYRTLGDFTWKELVDLDACTKCGRCHVACPAQVAGGPLSPRDLILDLRQYVDSQSGLKTVLDWEARPAPTGPLSGNGSTQLAGDVIKEKTLWSCTTCMACVEACPVGIEHVSTIVQMRRALVDDGRMEATLQDTLQNFATQGNSFGKSSRQRSRWTKGLDFKLKDARKEPVKYLWFVGDFASFDERVGGLSRTLATILNEAGIDFGILYEDERNSGNDVRRIGEEGLFEMLVEQNMEAFGKAEFAEIVTTDPHSLNTLRNEYPEFGLDKPVRHYTELLASLIEDGTLPVKPLNRTVTYHDPCYLARYNRVTDAPRRLLNALGCTLKEMPRNKDNTFCCGAGGGRIWMDDSYLAERPSENRIKEAVAVGVDTFVVACPKDMTMYTDAAKTTGNEETMAVLDVVQLLDAALDRDALAARRPAPAPEPEEVTIPEPVEAATAESEAPPEG